MKYCNGCHDVFGDDDFVIIGKDEEREAVCPHCHEWDVSDAVQCEVCGEWFGENEIDNACDECISNLVDKFNELLKDNFTTDERKILNEIYDGKEF
jgi:hypothetical protein